MDKIIILFGMLFCLFGPTVVFTIVGMRSMDALAKRPSNAPVIMIKLGVKFAAVAALLIGIQALMLKIFAPG